MPQFGGDRRYGQSFRIVVHGYLVGDPVFRSEMHTMLRGSINALAGQPVSGAISVSMDCENDFDEAESMTLEFSSVTATPLMESIVMAGAP